jgi:hypothetical protein
MATIALAFLILPRRCPALPEPDHLSVIGRPFEPRHVALAQAGPQPDHERQIQGARIVAGKRPPAASPYVFLRETHVREQQGQT